MMTFLIIYEGRILRLDVPKGTDGHNMASMIADALNEKRMVVVLPDGSDLQVIL